MNVRRLFNAFRKYCTVSGYETFTCKQSLDEPDLLVILQINYLIPFTYIKQLKNRIKKKKQTTI